MVKARTYIREETNADKLSQKKGNGAGDAFQDSE
jgi:hypothetical protein